MTENKFDFIKYDTPDDGAGGGGDLSLEGVFETEGGQEEELFFLEGDPDIPVLEEEGVEEDTPEMKALKDQNALLVQQMDSLKVQADSTAALTKGLESLGQNLGQPVQQVQSQVDPAIAAKKFNDEFYDDPAKNLDAFARAKIEPALQQMMLNNADLSKKLLLLDPARSETYKNHGSEVDEVFNKISIQKKLQNPAGAAQEAADIVASKHIPETRAAMKEEILKEVLAELKKEESDQEHKQLQPGQHSESGVTRKTAPKGKFFTLPKAVWAYAGTMGYQGRGEKDDQARVYQWWKEGSLIVPDVEYK